jgi:hypothetical protein
MKSKTKHKHPIQPDLKETARKLSAQIQGFYDEISVLSKSKPDNPLNAFKLKLINDILAEANTILVGQYQPLKGFNVFEDTNLPTNSDVVMVLSQYLTRLKAWQAANRAAPISRISPWD